MLDRDEDILKAAQDWQKAGHGVALATVVETWGSAPRPAGSSLVINDDGTFLGSVSGGCVEGAVVTEALDVIASGKPKMLEFGVADETAWNVGLSCGGTIRVFVEKVGLRSDETRNAHRTQCRARRAARRSFSSPTPPTATSGWSRPPISPAIPCMRSSPGNCGWARAA